MDSLNIKELVTQQIFYKQSRHKYVNWQDPAYNSVKDSIRKTLTEIIIYHYLADSIPLYSFLLYPGRTSDPVASIKSFDIADPQQQNNKSGNPASLDIEQALSDYYKYDPLYIKKLITAHTLTFSIPAGYDFFSRCHACGDCSCGADEAFPAVSAMRLVIADDDFIYITPANFKHIFKKGKYNAESNSYILEIE